MAPDKSEATQQAVWRGQEQSLTSCLPVLGWLGISPDYPQPGTGDHWEFLESVGLLLKATGFARM